MNDDDTDYKTLYLHMFNAITDTIEYMQNADCNKSEVIEILIRIQQQAEDGFIGNE